MSAPSQSVFISYAREDLAAARRIADALKAFEVKVWFDEAGLEGGDAWDQKIRRQIKECSLFIPIISTQTQARREAYFRLEWKLAEERTHLMAEGTAFLLPIAIDETTEDKALVPETFRRTQWTKLPRGVPNTQFVDRVRALLKKQEAHVLTSVTPVALPAAGRRRKWPVALVLALAVGASIPFWSRKPVAPPAPTAPAIVPAVADKSIAVLPFTNMSDDPENTYFADGVHEDILTDLANLSALKVISRTSVMQYRGTKKNLREIAGELGVAFILEGSVRRVGNKVRVTGQLINARTDEHIWAKAFDRDLTDVFALQEELARAIAVALQVALSPRETARLEKRPGQNMEAYDLYQQAMTILHKGVPQVTLVKALPLFERVVEIDPGYAKAWVQICRINAVAYWREDRSAGRLANMRRALAQAERNDPDDCDVLGAGATVAAVLGDRATVQGYRQKIIELYPSRPEAYQALAQIAFDEERWSDSLAASEQARALDPLNVSVLSNLENLLLTVRRYHQAGEEERAIVALDPGNYDAALRLACAPFLETGSTRELEALLGRLPADLEAKDPSIRNIRLEIMIMLGDGDGLIRLWRESAGDIKFFRNYSRRNARMLVAAAYLARREVDEARPLLTQNRDEANQEIATNPVSAAAYNDLGLALSMLGQEAEGRAALARALELEERTPNHFVRWQNIINRAWSGEKPAAIAGLREILRSPQMAPLGTNVYRLRVAFLTLPLHGDPDFEAMLKEPANNAPLF